MSKKKNKSVSSASVLDENNAVYASIEGLIHKVQILEPFLEFVKDKYPDVYREHFAKRTPGSDKFKINAETKRRLHLAMNRIAGKWEDLDLVISTLDDAVGALTFDSLWRDRYDE